MTYKLRLGNKFEIDRETADRITVANLIDARNYLQYELKEHEKGGWMHPDDVILNGAFINALDLLINEYYGGEE